MCQNAVSFASRECLILSVHHSGRLFALHHCLEVLYHNEGRGRHRHAGAGPAGIRAGSRQRSARAPAALGQWLEPHRGRSRRVARQAGHETHPQRLVPSDDPRARSSAGIRRSRAASYWSITSCPATLRRRSATSSPATTTGAITRV